MWPALGVCLCVSVCAWLCVCLGVSGRVWHIKHFNKLALLKAQLKQVKQDASASPFPAEAEGYLPLQLTPLPPADA